MRLLLVIDTYVPARISGALQMHDFAQELLRQGHDPVVAVPAPELKTLFKLERLDGVSVLRVNTFQTKDVGRIRRLVGEIVLPWQLLRALKASGLSLDRWDGVVWYSPTIFFGPLIAKVKRRSKCRSYLILRDLFPDWVVDAGLMQRGLAYRFFKAVERYQYSIADTIGVQTAANVPLVEASLGGLSRPVEVLHNWLAAPSAPSGRCGKGILGPIQGRIIFAYTGNMGPAQGMDCLIDLAEDLRSNPNVGFLFVGRGQDVPRLKQRVADLRLDSVVFADEVDAAQIPDILANSHVGMLALDPRHRTHNVPGKMLTYLHAGLPILARINPGNDLEQLIEAEGVGFVYTGSERKVLSRLASVLAGDGAVRSAMGLSSKQLAGRLYSPRGAVNQVVERLTREPEAVAVEGIESASRLPSLNR